MTTDTVGSTANHNNGSNQSYIFAKQITASASGTLSSVGINIYGVGSGGNISVAIYSESASKPSSLLGESASTAASVGWNDLAISGVTIVAGTKYWLCIQTQNNQPSWYWSAGNDYYVARAYGAYPSSTTWTLGTGWGVDNQRMTYTVASGQQLFTLINEEGY